MRAFFLFHAAVGARLALRKLAAVLAAGFAASYLLRPELFLEILGRLLDPPAFGLGVTFLLAAWGTAGMAARRICLGLTGWIRHLPASGLLHRRMAALAIGIAQLPLLLLLGGATLAACLQRSLSPLPFFLGFPILGWASALLVVPVKRVIPTRVFAFAAGVMSLAGQGLFLLTALALTVIAEFSAGPLSGGKADRWRHKPIPAALTPVLINLRAVALRIAVFYIPAVCILGMTAIFLSNNAFSPGQTFRAVCFGGTLAVVSFTALLANSLSSRRPPWSWIRSLPWSSRTRIIQDSVFIGLAALLNIFPIARLQPGAVWPVLLCLPAVSLGAAWGMRTAPENRAGALGPVLMTGTFLSVLVCLVPASSFFFLAAAPLLLKYAQKGEKMQKVSRWMEIHHLAAGDPLSWSRQ